MSENVTTTETVMPWEAPSEWDDQIEHVAAYLYRDEHDWARDAVWIDLPESRRLAYMKRARSVGYMFNFPYHTNITRQWNRLCPCDHDPNATQGPERDCPIHGEMPYAIDRLAQALAVARVDES